MSGPDHDKTSNKSLQPTAGRRVAHIWFYEPVPRIRHARCRQRWL